MRLLIIEDNVTLANTTRLALIEYGYTVDIAYNGSDGEEKAFVNSYDAILLDLNLPDKDGIEILKFLRGENIQTPVIIVTARDEIKQRALGLDLGADDYITKPFDLLELKSRVNAVIRRFNGRSSPVINIDNLSIIPSTREILWNNQVINLLPKEYDILEYLMMKYPKVVSSEEIVEHIYDEDFDPFSSVIRVHFSRLRKKLSDVIGYNIIITIRGKGVSICIK